MKDQEWYKKLWRDKLQQLPVEGDEQAMWQKMQNLLDEQMPVKQPSAGGKPGKFPGAGGIVSAVAIISATVALLYLSGVFKGKTHSGGHNTTKSSVMHRDSIKAIEAQPVNANNSTAANSTLDTASNPLPATNKMASTTASSGGKNPHGANAGNRNNAGAAIAVIKSNAKGNSNGHPAAANNLPAIVPNKNPGANAHSKDQRLIAGMHTGHSSYLQNNRNRPGHYLAQQHHNNRGLSNQNHTENNSGRYHNDSLVSNNNQTGNYAGQQNNNQQQTMIGQLLPNNNYPSVTDVPDKPDSAGQQQKADSLSTQFNKGQVLTQNNNTVTATNPANGSTANPLGNSAANKTRTVQNGKDKSKPAASSKNKNGKYGSGNSGFGLDIKLGMNTGAGSSPYFGIAAGYNFTPRVGVMIGADVMPSRTISGSYNSKTELTYRVDTGKAGIRQSGQITISGSRKIYTVDVPVTVNYRINRYVSVYGGPVISLPVKANATKPVLTKLANSNDTTKSLVAPYVSGTAIDNKAKINLTGGLKLNFNRLFINAGYMQSLQPYTISSGLGSSSVKYHTIQLGIGFRLFKPKGKKAIE